MLTVFVHLPCGNGAVVPSGAAAVGVPGMEPVGVPVSLGGVPTTIHILRKTTLS